MRRFINTYPNRVLCDVIKEARKCCETLNFSYLPGLLEEAQTMGNRLEAALEDAKDLKDAKKQIKEAREELTDIEAQIKAQEKLLEELKKRGNI